MPPIRDLAKMIPLPDDLPGSNTTEEDIHEWLKLIVPRLADTLKKNGRRLHAGQTIKFPHPPGISEDSPEMWKAYVLRVVELLEIRGYEAKADLDETPDVPVLKISIKKQPV